jgi:hypothetical protein
MFADLCGFALALAALCVPLLLAWGIVTWSERAARRRERGRQRRATR